MRKCYLLSFLLLFVTVCSVAQDSTKVTTLQEIVVSATRTEQTVIEIPRSVTVIGEDAIRNSIYQSVGELLNEQSGLFIAGANQTPGTNQNIFMRGANSNQVAVLVDGVRITDPSSPNAAIDFSEISLTNVERIEVIRGSHSTLFGGAAVGGVVNIITKKGAKQGVHGDVSWQGGAFGKDAWSSTGNVNLNYGTKGGFYVRGSLFRQDVDGLDASENLSSPFTVDRDDFRKTDGFVNAGFKNEKWDVSASFKNAHQYTEIDDGAFTGDENSYLIFDRELLQYSGRYKFSQTLELSLVGSLSNSERFFEDDSSRVSADSWDHVFTSGTYYGKLQTHEVQLSHAGDKVRALAGAGLYYEKMYFDSYLLYNDPQFPFESITNYDSIDTRTTTGYIFAKAGYSWKRFDVSGGVRFSRHTEAGGFFNFDLNPSYSVNDYLFYASLSTGFNPPSLYQLYDPSKSFSAFATRGNSSLEPERSTSIELGIKKQFASGSYLTLAGYQTQVRSSIEYVYLWNGEKAIDALDFMDDRGDRYINVGEQVVNGIEAEGLWQFNDALSLMGNISVLDTKVRAEPRDVSVSETGGHHVQLYNLGSFLVQEFEKEQVIRRPSFTAYSRLTWQPLSAISMQAIYRFTGNRYDAVYDDALGPYGALSVTDVDEYHLFDFVVNWRATRALSAALKVENILDEQYREVVGFQTRGRSVYLKLAVSF